MAFVIGIVVVFTCAPFVVDGFLTVFTAPMFCVFVLEVVNTRFAVATFDCIHVHQSVNEYHLWSGFVVDSFDFRIH